MTKTSTRDDLFELIRILPPAIRAALPEESLFDLLEIVLDLGRIPQARFPHGAISLSDQPLARLDLEAVVSAVGRFGGDNRAGIEGTLHRISALRNRQGDIIGLTLRVGRAVFGTIDLIRDLVESGKSVLLLGRPGVGKTTKLREVARVLADDLDKRVVIIDTSNEIAGDGDIPHPAIGGARRMMVPAPECQQAVMIEAVENHMPEVVIVDEIGTAGEAMAARTIAERGVQLIGTAHGNTLENLVMNPALCDLVGGIQAVILGDDEARFRGSQKTINERKGPPAFDAVVEIVSRDEVVVHPDTGAAVDAILRGVQPRALRRSSGEHQPIEEHRPEPSRNRELSQNSVAPAPKPGNRPTRIYAYALSRDSVDRVIRDLKLDARTVRFPDQADFIVALKAREDDPKLRRLTETAGIAVHGVRKNTTAQIRHLLASLFDIVHGETETNIRELVQETEHAVRLVKAEGVKAELAPRPSTLRKLQHRIVTRHGLVAESIGSEPHRHLVIYPM